MSKLKYLRSSFLTRLQAEVPKTLHLYEHGQPWLESYLGTNKFALESNLEIASDIKLEEPTGRQELKDFENTRIIYDALKGLTPLQASDKRLWTYLKLDIARNLLERTLGRNRNALHACLEVLLEHQETVKGDKGRDIVRDLVRELNFYGGVCILDHLDKSQIKEIATKKLEALTSK